MAHLVSRRARRLALAAMVPVLLTALTAPDASAHTTPHITVVARGLNNPRGLAFGEHGQLFVAEAGKGGPSCVSGPRGATCFGTTASISRISHGDVDRVVTGLISIASPDGSGATGPDGLSQRDDGSLYTIIAASPQQVPPGLPPGITQALYDQAGQLVRLGKHGGFRTLAGVGAYDWAWSDGHRSLNPQYPDANPYGVLATENQIYVVDAASNTLDRVGPDGRVSVLAIFPNPPVSDAVPTCIAQGRDGALYVGELTGDGNGPGSAVVWRVVPGHQPRVWQSHLTNITGCGFGRDGSFYVTEFQTGALGSSNPAGDVIRIARNGTRTSVGGGQIFLANGFAAGRDGSIYVSNWSVLPGTSSGGPTGEVVRISQ